MDIHFYIRFVRKYLWLFILAGFLVGGSSYLTASRRPTIYTAQVMLSVGGYMESPNPNSGEIYTGLQLVQTYAVLVTTYDVLQAAIDTSNLPLTPEQLRGMVSTEIVEGTSLFRLSLSSTEPVLVVDAANALAEQLVTNSPTSLSAEQQAQLELTQNEVARLSSELETYRAELQNTADQIAGLEAQGEDEGAAYDDLVESYTQLTEQINRTSTNLVSLSNVASNLEQRSNSLRIVEQARSASARGFGALNASLVGVVIGVGLAVGVALLVEYLDDTIKTPEDLTHALMLPVLAVIARFGRSKSKGTYENRLITLEDPTSPVSEAYRALRTNLLFASEDSNERTFIISSAGPSEGKSVTTANLAVALAATGLKVLLIDADLRRPKQHHLFGVENKQGFTTLLSADPADVFNNGVLTGDLRHCVQDTSVPGLRLITSGFIPSNPTEVLGSALIKHWVKALREAEQVDVVLFDTPPVLVVSDSMVLAAALKASAVLVVEAKSTRRGAAIKVKEQLQQLGIDIKGIVLNMVNPRDLSQGYGYGYGYGYYYYYYSSDTPSATSSRPRLSARQARQRGNNHSAVAEAQQVDETSQMH